MALKSKINHSKALKSHKGVISTLNKKCFFLNLSPPQIISGGNPHVSVADFGTKMVTFGHLSLDCLKFLRGDSYSKFGRESVAERDTLS
jgi:hypothetical protein